MAIDLEKIKKVYVIGIKGSGVVGVVEILKSRGIEVTGSDTTEKFFTDEVLKKNQIQYTEGFSVENIPADADLVIYSTSYNVGNNVEFQEVMKRKIPMISYPEILAQLFNEKYGIAICGTHGKTTTSAWLANTLKDLGADPSAAIGSRVKNWEGNALTGAGEFFVLEADEYQNKLARYNPNAVILTSCDYDHPDFFPDFEEYKKVFKDFVVRIPKTGFLVVCGDATATLEVASSATCAVLTYGFSDDCNYRIANLELKKAEGVIPSQTFEVMQGEKSLGNFEIGLFGKHNALNAAAVIAVCHKLNFSAEKIQAALKNFQGTARRFELIGERNGAILIDDYGHHPDEIRATLKAARELYAEKNIWAVFHPHTFTRTKALLSEFSQSFSDADKVIILDIYGSAREAQGGVHSKDLVDLVNKYDRGKAEYIATIDETVEFLGGKIGGDDVVIAIGAGNVWEVVSKLSEL
ncbi:MAG: UDP-N-acetylmuramate--L-alanine ligase [Candidatus Moranbacteria bacterium]|nr:UDP-N-acetylmuramate--L-alanine ligase [Candidatus Moranbacteria bacterium]